MTLCWPMSAIPQISLLLKRIFSKVDGRKPFQVLNAVVILSGALLYWMQKGELLMTANYLAARFCSFSGMPVHGGNFQKT